MRQLTLGVAVVVGLVVLAACSSPAPAPAPAAPKVAVSTPAPAVAAQPAAVAASGVQTFQILQATNQFVPDQVTVKAGSRVRFVMKNDDAEEHNIVSAKIAFPQNQQNPGSTRTVDWVAPTQPGTYDAICAFHVPNMVMKITVQ
jgi:plastocyanin